MENLLFAKEMKVLHLPLSLKIIIYKLNRGIIPFTVIVNVVFGIMRVLLSKIYGLIQTQIITRLNQKTTKLGLII
jgi:hypothetical protein